MARTPGCNREGAGSSPASVSMDDEVPDGGGEQLRGIDPAYPLGQLRRAMETAMAHPSAEVRRRAVEKARAWESVLDGMASGELAIGSRTPVADTPAWVTLEVAHGGFATGRFLAEGPLAPDEIELLAELPAEPDHHVSDRFRLNRWYLSDPGLASLHDALRDGRYTIELPEHGALLVVSWLTSNGHEAAALDLVAELYPLMHRLRFYPVLQAVPASSAAVVHLASLGEVRDRLAQIAVPRQVAAMNETLTVWHPLYDRLIELWSLTVVDGWPCAAWPPDWADRRAGWLADYEAAQAEHRLSHGHTRPRSTFAILRQALERCDHDSSALSGRDVGRIRAALNRSIDRWGAPGSDERASLRAAQLQHAARPTNQRVAAAVEERLAGWPADEGLPDLRPVTDPVTIDGTEVDVPPAITRKAQRALEAPIEELVERRIVPSSEELARLVPQISAHVAAASFEDPQLRSIYTQVYAAFRRRRSLLLLNLEHQVGMHELPWVRSIGPLKVPSLATRQVAIDTVRDLVLLAFTSFPQTILPNPLLTEITALAKQAEVRVPVVEEVAADIFMGTFTPKWRRAAAIAAADLDGSLYARYYDLPPASRWPPIDRSRTGNLVDRVTRRWSGPADDFAALCSERAKEVVVDDRGDLEWEALVGLWGGWLARTGAVLEQSQILTTHNLAPVVGALGLRDRLEPRAAELAGTCLRWVVKQQTTPRREWQAELHMLKNTAYAWRQALYFLSLVDEVEQREVAALLRASADERPGPWRVRFEPAIVGLESVIGGAAFDASGRVGVGRRFLGYSVGPHWLSTPRPESPPVAGAGPLA